MEKWCNQSSIGAIRNCKRSKKIWHIFSDFNPPYCDDHVCSTFYKHPKINARISCFMDLVHLLSFSLKYKTSSLSLCKCSKFYYPPGLSFVILLFQPKTVDGGGQNFLSQLTLFQRNGLTNLKSLHINLRKSAYMKKFYHKKENI